MSWIKFFNRPYPFYTNLQQRWKLVITISLFIGLFCVIFRPFGTNDLPGVQKYFIAFGFGGVTFIVETVNIVLLPFLFPKLLTEKDWTIGKEMLWVIWMLSTIAMLSYSYSIAFYPVEPSWYFFFMVQVYTLLIGSIPAVGVIFFKQVYLYKKAVKEVGIMNESLSILDIEVKTKEDILLESDNGKESIDLNPDSILYIESSGNYVEIFYLKEGSLRKKLLRNKISEMENKLAQYNEMVRCHRSCIVNIKAVEVVEGNSQGYKLKLRSIENLIPVARSNSKEIRKLITG